MRTPGESRAAAYDALVADLTVVAARWPEQEGGIGMDRVYTAEATAYGARTGAVVSTDERLDLRLSRPAGMGGDDGPGTNPEQLFAAGYAACFHSALRFAVRELGLPPACWRARTSPRACTS